MREPSLHQRWRGSLVAIDDTQLWVVRAGTGPLVLALHGGLGFDHTSLRPWLDPLAEEAEIAYVDLRGQGRSERLSDDAWSRVTHATFVADIDELRAALGHERMVLFGHSYGAYLALEYALSHPERLDGLILAAGGASFEHGAKIAANAIARGGELGASFLGALSTPIADDATFARDFPQYLPLYFHGVVPTGFMAETRYSAAACNRGFGAMLPGWNVSARLAEIEVPTLVLAGDDDFITPLDPCAEGLVRGLRHARLEVIAGSGHYPFVEDPERVLSALQSFLHELAT